MEHYAYVEWEFHHTSMCSTEGCCWTRETTLADHENYSRLKDINAGDDYVTTFMSSADGGGGATGRVSAGGGEERKTGEGRTGGTIPVSQGTKGGSSNDGNPAKGGHERGWTESQKLGKRNSFLHRGDSTAGGGSGGGGGGGGGYSRQNNSAGAGGSGGHLEIGTDNWAGIDNDVRVSRTAIRNLNPNGNIRIGVGSQAGRYNIIRVAESDAPYGRGAR